LPAVVPRYAADGSLAGGVARGLALDDGGSRGSPFGFGADAAASAASNVSTISRILGAIFRRR
jgi:hypothetical protein